MKIMKFGGTSVGNGSRIIHVAQIVKKHALYESIVVVISAMCGVTDMLISIFDKYKTHNLTEAKDEILKLYQLHRKAIKEMNLKNGQNQAVANIIDNLFGQLMVHLTVTTKYDISDRDHVISYGERLSVVLLSSALQKIEVKAKTVDSRDLIVTTSNFGNSMAIISKSKEKIENNLYPLIMGGIVPVVPGFYGATIKGRITTLGRGGSDYTATILAYALDAQEVVLWKEVDGVFTGDPRNGHKKAEFIAKLTYKKAIKMAQNGAKILHPEALKPAEEKEIIVWVKNTFNPDFIGTKICKRI